MITMTLMAMVTHSDPKKISMSWNGQGFSGYTLNDRQEQGDAWGIIA